MTEERYEWCADGLDIWDNQKEERIDYDFPVELNKLHDENMQLKQENKQLKCILHQLEKKYEDKGFSLAYNMEECE